VLESAGDGKNLVTHELANTRDELFIDLWVHAWSRERLDWRSPMTARVV
jgi:hypothetical protein